MISFKHLDNDGLLQRLAVLAVLEDKEEELSLAKQEVLDRIPGASKKEKRLLEKAIETTQKIAQIESDMIRESKRAKKLGKKYHVIKQELLSKMPDKNPTAACGIL